MAKTNKLYEKPRIDTMAADDLLTVGQKQADGTYKVKTITKENLFEQQLSPTSSPTFASLFVTSGISVGDNVTCETLNAQVAVIQTLELGDGNPIDNTAVVPNRRMAINIGGTLYYIALQEAE